ncbi:MAG: GIY-YIG nuclease family protein [Candidatus Kapabacteria bacterium]|nr:GIY-YIG nuclease family protein [Candidatus Kapabacteria bacterium]
MSNRYRTVLYTGVTSDLASRRLQHREESDSQFCGKYKVVDVVYVEWFDDIRMAITREKQIKGYRRTKKDALIKAVNPLQHGLVPPFFPFPPCSELCEEPLVDKHATKRHPEKRSDEGPPA